MYCDFYFNSKDAKVRIQICSKILMRIFNFFFLMSAICWRFWNHYFYFYWFFDPISSFKVETPQPLGGRGLLLHSLHLFKLQTEHLQLWKEHVFLFSDVQKGGGKNFWWTTERLLKWQTSCDDTIVSTKYRKIGVSLTRLLP